MKSIIKIYTDGSCVGNGTASAIGGWAAVLEYANHQLRIAGYGGQTTNNRMELLAAIEGLKAVKKDGYSVDLYTDSKYVQKGCESWMEAWKRNNWRTSNKKPVKNIELWKELDEQLERLTVTFHWVKGHSGHPMNDLVDELAVTAASGVGDLHERRVAGDTSL